MDINEVFLQWSISLLMKTLLLHVQINVLLTQKQELILIQVLKNNNQQPVYQLNCTSQLPENLNWGADIKTIQLISKYNKEFDFYYVLFSFIVNIYIFICNKYAWDSPLKDKNVLQLGMYIKRFQLSPNEANTA